MHTGHFVGFVLVRLIYVLTLWTIITKYGLDNLIHEYIGKVASLTLAHWFAWFIFRVEIFKDWLVYHLEVLYWRFGVGCLLFHSNLTCTSVWSWGLYKKKLWQSQTVWHPPGSSLYRGWWPWVVSRRNAAGGSHVDCLWGVCALTVCFNSLQLMDIRDIGR